MINTFGADIIPEHLREAVGLNLDAFPGSLRRAELLSTVPFSALDELAKQSNIHYSTKN